MYTPSGELTCSKSTFAQCSHVLRNKQILDRLVQDVINNDVSKNGDGSPKVQAKNVGLLYVLLYELLMGPNKAIRGGGALKRHLLTLQDVLEEKVAEISSSLESTENPSSDKRHNSNTGKDYDDCQANRTTIPRYVRVNTLKTDMKSVIDHLLSKEGMTTTNNKLKLYIDPHVPHLLVMDHTSDSRAILQDLVASNKVVLQDKSSCFPALCLIHGFDDDNDNNNIDDVITSSKNDDKECGTAHSPFHYLDACAAPGNKTSHLAALVHNQFTNATTTTTSNKQDTTIIHALDKSPDRFKLLRRRMKELTEGNGNIAVDVQCHNLDFLQQQKQSYGQSVVVDNSVAPSNRSGKLTTKMKRKKATVENNNNNNNGLFVFEHVRAILLDPSCSGSGMTNNHNAEHTKRSLDPYFTNERIQSLSDFQYHALKHALTAFPNVDRVVYSTCSIYVKENEDVVGRVLESLRKDHRMRRNDDGDDDNDVEPTWEVVAPKCLHDWNRRGVVPHNTTTDDSTDECSPPLLTPDQVKSMIRVDPHRDATNGFFVACLQRRGSRKEKGESSTHTLLSQQQKKKKGTSTKKNGGPSVVAWKSSAEMDLPKGVELYANQFDTAHAVMPTDDKNKSSGAAVNSSAPSSTKKKTKNESVKKATPATIPKRDGQKKRKAEESTAASSSSLTGADIHSKKRAKRAEWKVKQRLKKEARLKSKTPK